MEHAVNTDSSVILLFENNFFSLTFSPKEVQ